MLGGSLIIEEGSIFETPVFTIAAGVVSGRDTILGTVINNGGTVLPGESPGVLTIKGNYTQTVGRMVLEIGGLIPGMGYDQLNVTGALNLTGDTIELAFIKGFAPQAGQTFNLFDVSGTFSNATTFNVSGLEPGWEFDTAFNSDTGNFVLTSINNAVAVVEPSIRLTKVDATILELAYTGILQESNDLVAWKDVSPQPLDPWRFISTIRKLGLNLIGSSVPTDPPSSSN